METRSLLGWEFENPDVYNMTPIPWCTTHDERWHEYSAIMSGCFAGSTIKPCTDKSTGGPDHKWWKDA